MEEGLLLPPVLGPAGGVTWSGFIGAYGYPWAIRGERTIRNGRPRPMPCPTPCVSGCDGKDGGWGFGKGVMPSVFKSGNLNFI